MKLLSLTATEIMKIIFGAVAEICQKHDISVSVETVNSNTGAPGLYKTSSYIYVLKISRLKLHTNGVGVGICIRNVVKFGWHSNTVSSFLDASVKLKHGGGIACTCVDSKYSA